MPGLQKRARHLPKLRWEVWLALPGARRTLRLALAVVPVVRSYGHVQQLLRHDGGGLGGHCRAPAPYAGQRLLQLRHRTHASSMSGARCPGCFVKPGACPNCGGRGGAWMPYFEAPDDWISCDVCHGESFCTTCAGLGLVSKAAEAERLLLLAFAEPHSEGCRCAYC